MACLGGYSCLHLLTGRAGTPGVLDPAGPTRAQHRKTGPHRQMQRCPAGGDTIQRAA